MSKELYMSIYHNDELIADIKIAKLSSIKTYKDKTLKELLEELHKQDLSLKFECKEKEL